MQILLHMMYCVRRTSAVPSRSRCGTSTCVVCAMTCGSSVLPCWPNPSLCPCSRTHFTCSLTDTPRPSPRTSAPISSSKRCPSFVQPRRYKKVKASSYIAQYPVLRTVQSALHFTSLTDLFTLTPSRLLWEAPSHMLQLMHEGCSYTYPPLSIARCSFIQLNELEQCRVKKLSQGFNTAARIRPGFL